MCVRVCGGGSEGPVPLRAGRQLVSCRASGSEAALNEDAEEEEAAVKL